MVLYGWSLEKYCSPTDPLCIKWIREAIDHCRNSLKKSNPPEYWNIWRARLLGYFAGNQNTELLTSNVMSGEGCSRFFTDLIKSFDLREPPKEDFRVGLMCVLGVIMVAILTILIVWLKRRRPEHRLETTTMDTAVVPENILQTTIELRLRLLSNEQFEQNQILLEDVGARKESAGGDTVNKRVIQKVNSGEQQVDMLEKTVDEPYESVDNVYDMTPVCPKCPNNSPISSPSI